MTEENKRSLIIQAGKRLVEGNFVQGTWGNISIRLDHENMLLTPSGLDYQVMKNDDLVIMNINTMEYQGKHKPSSEKDLHAIIYRQRKDINAVIHSHPVHCSTIACMRLGLQATILPEITSLVGGDIRISKYALPSTLKLAKNVSKVLKDRNGCLIANHGVIAFGNNMEQAFSVIDVMEKGAKLYVDSTIKRLIGMENATPKIVLEYFVKNKIKNCNKRGRNVKIK